jgi:hypothetical protein
MSLIWHPDKHKGGDIDVEEATARFVEIKVSP